MPILEMCHQTLHLDLAAVLVPGGLIWGEEGIRYDTLSEWGHFSSKDHLGNQVVDCRGQ